MRRRDAQAFRFTPDRLLAGRPGVASGAAGLAHTEIRNMAQSLCLEGAWEDGARGRNVGLFGCTGQSDQLWDLVERDGKRELRNCARGMCLDVEDTAGRLGANVLLWDCDGGSDQLWAGQTLTPSADRLLNASQGLCLDVEGTDGKTGANVILWDCDGGKDQLWTLNDKGEVRNAAQQMCLEGAWEDGAKGRNVGLFTCTGQSDQLWDVMARNNRFELRNRARGMCLDVQGVDGRKGANVLLWDCDGGADQLFSWGNQTASAPVTKVTPPAAPAPQPSAPAPTAKRDCGTGQDDAGCSTSRDGTLPMDAATFTATLSALKGERSEINKRELIKTIVGDDKLATARQMAMLLDSFKSELNKLDVAETLVPQLVDKAAALGYASKFKSGINKRRYVELVSK